MSRTGVECPLAAHAFKSWLTLNIASAFQSFRTIRSALCRFLCFVDIESLFALLGIYDSRNCWISCWGAGQVIR
jgi:hypothetical protein